MKVGTVPAKEASKKYWTWYDTRPYNSYAVSAVHAESDIELCPSNE